MQKTLRVILKHFVKEFDHHKSKLLTQQLIKIPPLAQTECRINAIIINIIGLTHAWKILNKVSIRFELVSLTLFHNNILTDIFLTSFLEIFISILQLFECSDNQHYYECFTITHIFVTCYYVIRFSIRIHWFFFIFYGPSNLHLVAL